MTEPQATVEGGLRHVWVGVSCGLGLVPCPPCGDPGTTRGALTQLTLTLLCNSRQARRHSRPRLVATPLTWHPALPFPLW